MIRNRLAFVLAGALLSVGFSMPALSQQESGFFDGVAKGEWTVRFRDGTPARKVCLRSGAELTQLRFVGPRCERLVVDESANAITVHYSCKTRGFSRTSIRKETGSLMQIESQGFIDEQPFQYSAEARRTGAC